MTQLPELPGLTGPSATAPARDTASSFNQLEVDDFFGLLLAELQNQDPLEPLSNAEMLQQISQIREVGATDRLTETLDAVLLGQNIASATSLIGQEIDALADDGTRVTGIVNRITINDGEPLLELSAVGRHEASDVPGEIEAGTYRYTVTFFDESGQLTAVELGPVETTGVSGLDRSIRLVNLPVTAGPKTVYRTDASGAGPRHLVGRIDDGSISDFTDAYGDDSVSSTVLSDSTIPALGATTVTARLSNVAQVRRPPG